MRALDLPVLSLESELRDAYSIMRLAGRSAVVIQRANDWCIAQAPQIVKGISAGLARLGSIQLLASVQVVPVEKPFRRSVTNTVVVHVNQRLASILESGPSLCYCDANDHPASSEQDGQACREPGCHGVIYCLNY